MQGSVSTAVLVGRVSPQPQKQAQGGGIVAGTGPVQWGGLPSIYIKAWVSLEEGLRPGQATRGQVPTEAALPAAAAGSRGHGAGAAEGAKASVRLGPGPARPAVPLSVLRKRPGLFSPSPRTS